MPNDLEVSLKSEHSKAVIEGKTSVPFKTFVQLVLQRKVTALFKAWGNEPVIVESNLLTSLASAPGDAPENRVHVIIVTLGIGILGGVFAFALLQALLILGGEITLGLDELMIIAGSLLAVGLLGTALANMKRRNRAEKVADAMEKIAGFLSRR